MARFIIGFDIGHGQCSVAKMDIDGNGKPEDLCILQGEKLINSHMLQVNKEEWVLDPTDSEISNALQKLQQINDTGTLTFKDSIKVPIPLGEDQAAKKEEICNIIKIFLKQLFKTIDNTNQPGIIPDPESVLYFACPSAWNNDQVAAYGTVINEALCEYLDENNAEEKTVTVIRESDAAYIASRKNWRNHNLPANPHVLIIDFGSSTIDFTWYGDSDLIHDGDKKEAGASKVEKVLFYYIKNNEIRAKQVYDETKSKIGAGNAENLITTRLRKQKEVFFRKPDRESICSFSIAPLVAGLEYYLFGPKVPYSAEKINEILSCNDEYLNVKNFDGRNYMGQVKAAFEEFKNSDRMKGRQIDAVIITGGASRMPFVGRIAREVFNTSIIQDANHDCDFVVSRGTAIWGRYHYLASSKIEHIRGKLFKDWGITVSNNTLLCEGNNTDHFYISKRIEPINYWKNELLKLTKDTYKEYITKILSSWTNDDAYSYKMGHNLKAVLEALPERQKNQSWINLFADLQKDEKSLVGRRSIHSLLRNIYDCIDGNDELLSNINAALKSKLKENVYSHIVPLLEEYYKVYFGQEAELPIRFLDPIIKAKVDSRIFISFTHEKKEELLIKLIETTMDYISKYYWKFSDDSFNKDRIGNATGPGVYDIQNLLEQPLEDFAMEVNPFKDESIDKSIEKTLKKYAESIKDAFLSIKKECQGSLYTPNSTVSQNLFGENGTTNPTNAE